MAILGLLDAEKFTAQRFKNIRRSVFYFYPNGAAPLMGLLSLLEDEDSNDPEINWFEKTKDDQRTTTSVNTTGAFINPAISATADMASPTTIAVGATLRVIVVDASKFRVGHIVRISAVPVTGTTALIQGYVTAVYGGTGAGGFTGVGGVKLGLDIRMNEAATAVLNIASSLALEVLIVGNVASEGQIGAAPTSWNLPIQPSNYLQIMRTPFTMTGTACKTSATFDDSGPYKDKSKEATINHQQEIEKNFIFGRKYRTTDATTGLPIRFMAGILWFMEQWEVVVGGGALNTYNRLGATADTDDDKRIITNAGGTINDKTYDKYLERLFRITNNKTNEKLVLCGSGFLMVMNQMYRGKTQFQMKQGSKDETYGMTIVSHLTSFGTIHYRTHPLFSENPVLRFSGLFLDIHNLKYRYLQGRDTQLLKHRQPNNADYREDEFLTEAGLETQFPQANMFLQNVLDFT